MGKKKKEHVTFDRLADKRVRINKKTFTVNEINRLGRKTIKPDSSCVFTKNIKDWASWGEVFQSIPAFEKLIYKIFNRESLCCGGISHLTAGSNAVFRVGSYVVKIFAPVESGMDTQADYTCEMLGMKRAMKLGINIPNVVAASFIKDKYLFRYIIMDYIEGEEAAKVLGSFTDDKKKSFVYQLRENLQKMNTAVSGEFPDVDIKQRAVKNQRWNIFLDSVNEKRREIIMDYKMPEQLYVHGDITGDNVIIDNQDKLYIIDFADGRKAPAEYELAPVLFDLFNFDKLMIFEFIKGQNIEEFTDKCFYGILMHEFGAYFMELICKRLIGIKAEELDDIFKVKEALYFFLTEI